MRSCVRALKYMFLIAGIAWGLSGCVYPAGPGYAYYDNGYYGAPAYYPYAYAGPPVYGSVVISNGRGWGWHHRGWR